MPPPAGRVPGVLPGLGSRPGAVAGPDLYWAKVRDDLWPNLAGLLGANAIFLAWCGPSLLLLLSGLERAALATAPVTVGPGLVGLATYAGRLARGESGGFWRDSLRGARTGFVAGVALGVLGGATLCAQALALRAAGAGEPTVAVLALLAAQAAVMTVAAMVSAHALSLVGLYGQTVREAFRNALLLSLRHPGATAGLLGLAVAALALAGAVGWGLLVILPAALSVCATNRTLLLVRGHLVP